MCMTIMRFFVRDMPEAGESVSAAVSLIKKSRTSWIMLGDGPFISSAHFVEMWDKPCADNYFGDAITFDTTY